MSADTATKLPAASDSPEQGLGVPRLVLCFAIPNGGDVDAVATDAQGNFLSAQVCSDEGWAKSDLLSGFHRWFYRQKFGDDFKIEWSDQLPVGWDGRREHTDETVKPWHLDPANGSTLFQENA